MDMQMSVEPRPKTACVYAEGQSLRDALQQFLLGKGVITTTTTPTADISEPMADAPRLVMDSDPQGLGHALAWLLVNRPASAPCSLEVGTGYSPVVLLPTEPSFRCSAPPGAADPDMCVEIFHLHCHFGPATIAEAAALELLESTRGALLASGVTPLHSHIWHEKNGPHDPWSWELWVEGVVALGVAVTHLAAWRRPANADTLGLYLCVHADTDQEFTDHAERLAWIGPIDPRGLDLNFFPLPDVSSYAGPHTHVRKSDRVSVYSMGEAWRRDAASPGGALLGEGYGAMDRGCSSSDGAVQTACTARGVVRAPLPSLFLPHGSPPIPIEPCASSNWLATAAAKLPSRPRAIVFMSPHYRADTFTVGAHPAPKTMMDFDDDTDPEAVRQLCALRYPCPGDPQLARRVASMLCKAGLPCDEQPKRGLDHGIWTPLYIMFPHARVPVVPLSVRNDLDTTAHIAAGLALAPLRHEGVLLIGSGEAVHNVPCMGERASPQKDFCRAFEGWLEYTLNTRAVAGGGGLYCDNEQRDSALAGWRDAPSASQAHPPGSPGEHLMPLFFAYGAAGEGRGEGACVHKEYLGSLPMAAYEFGRHRATNGGDKLGVEAKL